MRNSWLSLTLAIILLLGSLHSISFLNYQERKVLHGTLSSSKSRPFDEDSTLIRIADFIITSSDSWEHTIDSTHFSVRYNTTGSNAVTHEYAQNVSNAFEYSWTTEVTDFGFTAPPDSHMNVYLEDLPDAPNDVFGETNRYWSPITGWHVENITIDTAMNPGLVNVTCAHEFFHTIQLAYYPDTPDAVEKGWITEGMPVWMESKVYPQYVDYGSYVEWVNDYMNDPNRLITELDYSAVLYWVFLDEHYSGINTIRNILQQTTSMDGIYAVNATLNTKGTTFSKVFAEWTIANYLKDSYYGKGALFQSVRTVPGVTLPYNGEERIFHPDVSDWAANYFEVSSSVIYMPMQFLGEESHNVTKIFIEHGIPIISRFELNATYDGTFNLTQANNLDKVVVIIRSLGNEASNNVVSYYLKFPSSSYTLEGPKQLTSSTTTLIITAPTSSSLSSTPSLVTAKTTSSQASSTSTMTTVNSSSSQTSSQTKTAIVGKSSFQNSSETVIQVMPAPPTARFTFYPSQPHVDETVIFDGSASTPNGGTIISYEWNFGDGNTTVTSNYQITHEYEDATTYTVTLNVTDSEGLWSTMTKSVSVRERAPPRIEILSPLNRTYCADSVPLTFEIDETVCWIGYSLDNHINVTVLGNTSIVVEDGTHQIVVYTNNTIGMMGLSEIAHFSVNASLYAPWKSSFIGSGGYPIVDFAVSNGRLYAAADNTLYVYDGSNWDIIDAPTYVTSLEALQNKLLIGGKGGLYSYNGTTFTLVFSVSTCIKTLGVCNDTLYAGTFLDNPPTLYYCNGSVDNPSNWYIDTGFWNILNFSGPFGSIDSFVEYNGILYITSGGTIYSFNGTEWNIANTFDDVYGFSCMKVYNGELYLATRDQGWRKPFYQGGTGFSGRVIEFDGGNWTTVLDHDYWVYSLEEYDGKLYAGTANQILTYNGTSWETSFNATEGAYYAIAMINYEGKIYAGMGNGYIFADPAPAKAEQETITVPEFSSTAILAVFMALTMLAGALTRKNRSRRFS